MDLYQTKMNIAFVLHLFAGFCAISKGVTGLSADEVYAHLSSRLIFESKRFTGKLNQHKLEIDTRLLAVKNEINEKLSSVEENILLKIRDRKGGIRYSEPELEGTVISELKKHRTIVNKALANEKQYLRDTAEQLEGRIKNVEEKLESAGEENVYHGAKGQKGERGYRGLRGRGLKGSKGDIGSPGVVDEELTGRFVTRYQGTQGQKGSNGSKGSKGEKGPEGPTGQHGLPGAPGPTGSRGLDGFSGFPGRDGPKGEKGSDGLPGLTENVYHGAKGQKGERGYRGLRGRGLKGSKGDIGSPGVVDEELTGRFVTRYQGTQGQKGSNGSKGSKGEKGPEGPTGQHGLPGAPGPTGSRGLDGFSGFPGRDGPKGEKGSDGLPGLTAKAVSFSARKVDRGGSLGSKQRIVFNEVLNNNMDGYNSYTGMFVAPVTGVYLFIYYVEIAEAFAEVDLIVGGNVVSSARAYSMTTDINFSVSGFNNRVTFSNEKKTAIYRNLECARGKFSVSGSGNTLNVQPSACSDEDANDLGAIGGNAAVTYVNKGEEVWIQTSDESGNVNVKPFGTTFTGILLSEN